MTLNEIANELVAGCREDRARANLKKLYSPDAQSVEAADMGGGRTVTGIAAIDGKHAWWEGAMTMHGLTVDGPFVHGDDRFAVIFQMDVTDKATGKRTNDKEVGVYHVKNGKIVREEFFYAS
ncbi:nuclear transport factor 2 family protein [Tabrizicola sp.]|uniref:nuclear transport factor 2 family protein n=1 Tax=Tabrizicola sp. TaxID=2005166 RepID=UPI00286A5D40|nr:nuclear transport factor 2 family protein [Tabrizicola sp.]